MDKMLILQIVTVLALVTSLSFVVYYSRFRFEDTPEGINQMITAASVGLLSTGYIVFRVIENEFGIWILVTSWLSIAGVFIWRILRLRQLHKDDKIKVKEK